MPAIDADAATIAGYTISHHPRFGDFIEDGPTCGRCSQIIGPDEKRLTISFGVTVHTDCATDVEREHARAESAVAAQVETDRTVAILAALERGVAVEHETGAGGRFWHNPDHIDGTDAWVDENGAAYDLLDLPYALVIAADQSPPAWRETVRDKLTASLDEMDEEEPEADEDEGSDR